MPARVDAAVVLGCRVEATGVPSEALTRRLRRALEELERGHTTRVVVSGGRAWGGHVEADSMATWLVAQGVDASAVVRERLSLTTVENALFVAELARRRGFARIALVTCEWHLPRAARSFTALGLHCELAPATSPPIPAPDARRRAAREWLSGRLDRMVARRASLHGPAHPFRLAFEAVRERIPC